MIKMVIDRRKHYGIMLDTETANTIVEEDGKLCMNYVLPYDVGFAVIDSKGNIYQMFSFVNEDIFLQEFKLMQSAYYAEKIPLYIKDLAEGRRKLATTYEIRKALFDMIDLYDCDFICAHNARFDVIACNNVQRWTTKSKYRYFFPPWVEIWDTLRMAQDVICKMPTYIEFCKANGFMTKHATPRPQATAEIIYRFITGNTGFAESHTGLEDVQIEAEILKYCVRQHKPMRKVLYEKKFEKNEKNA